MSDRCYALCSATIPHLIFLALSDYITGILLYYPWNCFEQSCSSYRSLLESKKDSSIEAAALALCCELFLHYNDAPCVVLEHVEGPLFSLEGHQNIVGIPCGKGKDWDASGFQGLEESVQNTSQ